MFNSMRCGTRQRDPEGDKPARLHRLNLQRPVPPRHALPACAAHQAVDVDVQCGEAADASAWSTGSRRGCWNGDRMRLWREASAAVYLKGPGRLALGPTSEDTS